MEAPGWMPVGKERQMQISNQEVTRVLRESAERPTSSRQEAPVTTVPELAAKQGVSMDEVRRFTEKALLAEEDPARERRVQELARRVAQGTYRVDADQVVDMAERRAIADCSGEL
jgi:anti-sigma28 factor (negative regulator of flagellin synthesis)